MRELNRIIIHATATPEGKWYNVDEVRKWHTTPIDKGGRGFNDIGYHYLILLNGIFEIGRPLSKPGAHCQGYNRDSIGIAYVGGLDENGKAKDTRTQEQKEGLKKLVNYLLQMYPTITEIKGHRDYSPDLDGDGTIERHEWIKMCPCFNVQDEFNVPS